MHAVEHPHVALMMMSRSPALATVSIPVYHHTVERWGLQLAACDCDACHADPLVSVVAVAVVSAAIAAAVTATVNQLDRLASAETVKYYLLRPVSDPDSTKVTPHLLLIQRQQRGDWLSRRPRCCCPCGCLARVSHHHDRALIRWLRLQK